MNMKWNHVRGNTWCIEGRVCIPVYLLNEGEAVLLDSGYAEDRPQLDALLREKGLRVRAILAVIATMTTAETTAIIRAWGQRSFSPRRKPLWCLTPHC